ncbi:hypothetical protein Bca4012_025016 [Brassica carinata]
MDTTASSAAASRGGGSLQSRKEWRAVSDSHNFGNATGYVNGREGGGGGGDLDFYSVTVDGSCSEGEILEQIRTLSRQKGELQQQEVELRAQIMAMEIQRSFESRSAEYEKAAAIMQEQLREKERSVREMERKLEEKDRELLAVKLDSEAAWAKEGLLREQNKELATLRRERDHSDAERSQNIHKLSELQEHFQEKERQYAELQEQNRIAQETVMYKDEQLREAQGWIARAQEMDALQSSTNHSLQAELRERTEQYNQLWLGCQRQFAEMERLHVHTVQQLELELANVKEGGGLKLNSNGDSHSQTLQNSGNQIQSDGNETVRAKALEMDRILTVSVFSHGTSPPHFAQSVLLQQKAGSQLPMQNHVLSQGVHGLVSSNSKSDYQVHANGQSLGQGYQTSHGAQFGSTTPASSVNEQIVESGNGSNTSENNFQDISSQFHDALRLDSNALNQKPEEDNGQVSPCEQNGAKSIVLETLVSSGNPERNLESALLDERSLLACIVRTIPAGGRIRISSTLPNRLAKMLAPLHWHDYKKKYGKLDDFVASHLELFGIEDDYIQVREGAQKMVAASASAAGSKVAASSSPNSMYVAMTPMARGGPKQGCSVARATF